MHRVKIIVTKIMQNLTLLVTCSWVVLMFIVLPSRCDGLESIDVLKPIVKISPAKRVDTLDDFFGYSVAAHQFFNDSSGMSLQDILEQTVIMIGAPRGQFPGGLTNISVNRAVCEKQFPLDEVLTFNETQILECYSREGNRTGLVYQCSLSTGDCTAPLGNGDALSPDGLLFDRVGNVEEYYKETQDYIILSNKNGQQMGATVYSNGDVFVACAPLFEYVASDYTNSQPRGRCVYSNRNLTNFVIIQPCDNGAATTQLRQGYCETGFSVNVMSSSNENMPSFLVAGVPGREFSSGGAYFYNTSFTPTMLDKNMVLSPTGSQSLPNEHFTYYGFAMSSGYLTSRAQKNLIISSPRYTEYTQLGRVYILEEIEKIPTIHVDGEQFGEYFGYSIAVADLNGDEWDDFLVTAPIYSEPSKRELGRVYVYYNNEGKFIKSAVLTGTAKGGRFGNSITNLGDLNNDGFEDIAISAPYEEGGMVYIFHGQKLDDKGSIINTTIQQRINGSSVVNQISNLTSISSFGFSLSGNTDVDQNQYRDLVVGAHESQAVFVLRAIPVAVANISMNVLVNEIKQDNNNCSHPSSDPVTCFIVTICSEYQGKGLVSGFNTKYLVKEIPKNNAAYRLFFDFSLTKRSITRNITFVGINQLVCDNVTVYVKNSNNVDDVYLRAELQQIPRDDEVISTNDLPLDLSHKPVIDASPFDVKIPFARECGPDDVCRSDVSLTIVNVTYLAHSGQQYINQTHLSVGAIERISVYLNYSNNMEDAFNVYFIFIIPRIFEFLGVFPQSRFINCNDSTPSNITHAFYECFNIKTPLKQNDGSSLIFLNLQVVSSSLRGDEGDIHVPISIIVPYRNYSMDVNENNNHKIAVIPVVAASNFTVTLLYSSNHRVYYGNGTPTVNNIASNLGSELILSVSFQNKGPSPIISGILDILIPSYSDETGDNYYYYPASLQIQDSDINCDESNLNPQKYQLTSRKRRRRLVPAPVSWHGGIFRSRRQDQTFNVDCSRSTDGCIPVRCNVTSFSSGTISINIKGYVDERFFGDKTGMYSLRAFANFTITDGITIPLNPVNSGTNYVELVYAQDQVGQASLPWYAIVAPLVTAIIIVVIVGVILYCFGFFQRKKFKKKERTEVDDDFEQFAQNPFGNNPQEGGSTKSGTTRSEEKENKENTELQN